MNNDSRLFAAAVNLSRQKGEIRYELADSEVLELYYTEPRLAALIEMDVIRLIDRHLVVNLKKFITPKTHHLSAHAKRNKPACCVGIQYVPDVQYAEDGENIISCTLDILLQAAGFLEKGEAETGTQSDAEQKKEASKIDAEIARLNGILSTLPGGFSESLKCHMKRKGYTEELLAQESWVSVSTIKQYRQKEEKEKTLKTVTALCIGMHLHPWLTEDLLRKAGIVPKATKLDGAYRFLYTAHYKDKIEDCNVYLKSQGLPVFTMREKA
ncbi:MAG: hypothetical protein SPK56_01240 [Eubacteriales bacterium]|nr:hypothetical protein [Clostridiales bacterium]MDY5731809.1 hypothetical protein [Eubacteriales bacterium]